MKRFLDALSVHWLPLLVACWLTTGQTTIIPWQARTADLAAYREAAVYLLSGRDFYQLDPNFFYPFIYPPISAVLAIPLALVPLWVGQLAWTVLNYYLLWRIVRYFNFPSDWRGALVATGLLLFSGPLASLLGLGQIGLVLTGLVFIDLFDNDEEGERRLPVGVLTGLAAGLKLVPGIFIVHLLFTGRRKAAYWAVGTFFATAVIGTLASPQYAWGYWARLAGGDSGANPDAFGWLINISVQSASQRFFGVGPLGNGLGLLLSLALVVLSLLTSVRLDQRGHRKLGLSLLGVCSALANPIAWHHHLSWLLPLLLLLLLRNWPTWFRMLAMSCVLFLMTMPQFALGGDPWAVREIFLYTWWEKLYAAGPDLAVTIILIASLFLPAGEEIAARQAAPSATDATPDKAARPTPDAVPVPDTATGGSAA